MTKSSKCWESAVHTAAVAVFLLVPLLIAAPVSAQVEPIIRVGDELEVIIPGARRAEEDTVMVNRSGEIYLREYGLIEVADMTEAEALEVLVAHLERYVRDTSRVRLRLSRRIRHVLVTGQVADAGLVTLEGEPHPWMAIQAAGGTLPGADIGRVRLFRDGGETILNVHAYLRGTLSEPLPEVLSGDTIFVPAESGMPAVMGSATAFLSDEGLQRQVFVLGAVESPGVFQRMPGLNPMTALALAGGSKPEADLANVRLITAESSERIDLEAILLGDPTIAIFPEGMGVIMFVPERRELGAPNPFAQQVYFLGRTAFQGPVNVSGRVRLIDLLGRSGGFAPDADVDEVFLIRQGERSSLALHYELEDYLHEGGALGSVWVHPGDVLFIDVLPATTVWQDVVGAVTDLAIISSAVLFWVDFAGNR